VKPRDVVEEIVALSDAGRLNNKFRLLPPVEPRALAELSTRLGTDLPPDVRDLLEFASGLVSDGLGHIDFTGGYLFAYEDVFPISMPILPDNTGNFWVVDVSPGTGSWGPVFFACHDPLMFLVQADSLSEFLKQILDAHLRKGRDALKEVRTLTKMSFTGSDDEVVQVAMLGSRAIRCSGSSRVHCRTRLLLST
jgi:cell wall assembly regulator SMI1